MVKFGWAYDGVNASIPRNTGPECAYYLDSEWRKTETLIVFIISSILILWGYCNLSHLEPVTYYRKERGGKRFLLILMCLIWGMEIGFKFSSRTVIYLLNPCHITTAMQIYLLAAPPSKTVTAIFRIHLNYMNGPVLAFLFPEVESRTIPMEGAIYWIQHGMMFVVPFYLLRIGGVYNMEPIKDYSWNALSYGLNLLYHFTVLQYMALPTQINLNHMLCPAMLDPFQGPYYRLCATVHQALLCPLVCKLFYIVAKFIVTEFPYTKVKPTLECDLTLSNGEGGGGDCVICRQPNSNLNKNGRSHID